MVKSFFNFRLRLTIAIFLVAVGATITGLVYYYQVASQRIWSQMTNRVKDFGKIGVSLFNAEDMKYLEKLDQDLNSPKRAARVPVPVSGAAFGALADEEKMAILRTTKFQLIVQKLRRLRYSSGQLPVQDATLPAVGSTSGARPQIHRAWIAGMRMHEMASEYLRVLCADEFEEIDRNNNHRIDPEETIYHVGDIFNGRGQPGVGAALHGEVAVGSGYRTEYSGAYISGYTPIKNARGKTIALLIVDFSAATEFDALFGLKVTGYYILIGVFLFSIAAASLTSRFLLKPLDAMQAAAARIGQRDFSVRIESRSNDELGDLAYAINLMAHELGEYSTNMERRIATRTGEISGILDSLEQGLLTVDHMGIIQGEYSRQTLAIFGVGEIANRKFSSLFPDEKMRSVVEQFLQVSFHGQNISRQMLDKANPLREIEYQNIRGETRHLRFTFRPLVSSSEAGYNRLLVSIVDDTLNFALRQKISQAEAAKRSEFDVLISLMQIPAGIREGFITQQQTFLAQGKAIISKFDAVTQDELADFSRQVHALKGNALQLGFAPLSELLHALENYLQAKISRTATDERYLRHEISRCINESEKMIVDRDRLIARIRELVGSTQDDPEAEIRQLRRFWQAQIEQKAAEKEIPVSVTIELAAGTESSLHQLHNVLVQMVRNTFAHGVESAGARTAAGKSAELAISLVAQKAEGKTTVIYREDGRGFRALQEGSRVPYESLVQKGLTAPNNSATLESGRGLGMQYIVAALTRLNAMATVQYSGGVTTIKIDLRG